MIAYVIRAQASDPGSLEHAPMGQEGGKRSVGVELHGAGGIGPPPPIGAIASPIR